MTEEGDVKEGESVGPQARAGRPHLAVHQDGGDVRWRGPEISIRVSSINVIVEFLYLIFNKNK